MNIYLLSQGEENGFDTYDSCVVVAKSADKAKEIHPSSNYDKADLYSNRSDRLNAWNHPGGTWASTPDNVTATLVGKALASQKENTIICASFNAG
jgi:hypothetical protein